MLAAFLEGIRDGDMIAPRLMADRLRVPMTQLSKLARVNRNTLASHADSPAVQAKLGAIARLIARAAAMSGDEGQAVIWFRHQPIVGFSGKTAEQLVEQGHADVVSDYLDSLEMGSFA